MTSAIRAEVRKVFTTRLWWGLIIGLLFLSGGLAALFASLVGNKGAGGPGSPFNQMSVGTAQVVYAGGFAWYLTPLLPLALGVILITQEFRHQTLSATFLAVPRRGQVMAAKAVAVVVIGVVYGLVHVVLSAIFGGGVLSLRGYATYLTNGEVIQTFALSLLCFVLWALFGFGVGLLIRNQIGAVFVALGVGLIGQLAFQVVFALLKWDVAAKLLPANLSLGMLITSDPTLGATNGGSPYFDWWACALIMLGYAVVLAGVGSVLLSRRDVS